MKLPEDICMGYNSNLLEKSTPQKERVCMLEPLLDLLCIDTHIHARPYLVCDIKTGYFESQLIERHIFPFLVHVRDIWDKMRNQKTSVLRESLENRLAKTQISHSES
jgi:hypothetical protein